MTPMDVTPRPRDAVLPQALPLRDLPAPNHTHPLPAKSGFLGRRSSSSQSPVTSCPQQRGGDLLVAVPKPFPLAMRTSPPRILSKRGQCQDAPVALRRRRCSRKLVSGNWKLPKKPGTAFAVPGLAQLLLGSCPYSAVTSTDFGFATSAFGTVTTRTPSRSEARTPSVATAVPRANRRVNRPTKRSRNRT